jgi:hypothetical protein
MMSHMESRIEVSIANQTLSFWEGHRLVKQWPCSTSKFGIGFQEGSNCTPLGGFRIMEKHGAGADEFTVFKARVPIWQWSPDDVTDADLILARILWLEGTEERNANTKERYIYIHGTNGEDKIGQRASHGCIRMRNADVVSLFEIAEVGMPVWIGE